MKQAIQSALNATVSFVIEGLPEAPKAPRLTRHVVNGVNVLARDIDHARSIVSPELMLLNGASLAQVTAACAYIDTTIHTPDLSASSYATTRPAAK